MLRTENRFRAALTGRADVIFCHNFSHVDQSIRHKIFGCAEWARHMTRGFNAAPAQAIMRRVTRKIFDHVAWRRHKF